jgi:hypothetical protein
MLEESSDHPTGVEATATASRRRAILVVLLAIVLCTIAVLVVRPRMTHWLSVRAAYRNLSHQDESERIDAVRWLVDNGENPDEALIALLNHSDEGVRIFAAAELASRRPVTDHVVETFLTGLESGSSVDAIEQSAPNLFFRHAQEATGPLTETEQRMIASLRRMLGSRSPYMRRNAAMALAAFLHRDPSLREPLTAFLPAEGITFQYPVARQIARNDPTFRDEYVELLLSGVSSGNAEAERMAVYYLKELQRESEDIMLQLEARRGNASGQNEASRIDRALELIQAGPPPTE